MTTSDDPGVDARLDSQLAALPREIDPPRDLWPGIAARLDAPTAAQSRRAAWLVQAAAAVLLVAGSSLLTARLVERRAVPAQTAQSQPPRSGTSVLNAAVGAMPAAFGPNVHLDPEYMTDRRQLTAMLQARLAKMPPSTRTKLELNLAEMRRAAEEINAALAEQPGDPLLQELLLKTYQDELAVLSNVSALTSEVSGDNSPPPEKAKRMEL